MVFDMSDSYAFNDDVTTTGPNAGSEGHTWITGRRHHQPASLVQSRGSPASFGASAPALAAPTGSWLPLVRCATAGRFRVLLLQL